ncbi:hypothetical protein AcW1_001670 [Taiwanofungus camphoratus]|nr:hypothetical protein AcV5_000288 [Antrodia cinnamomea]KAI0944835.1 hypothetical protein AcV7_001527 [Antrodia cinnamomea]KAI0945451.1 hypothetical protein AcW1_001670 [Antrodia cinnamomea]
MSAAAEEYQDSDLTFKFAISATCLLVWDTIIHVADEVEYIWSGPPSWIRWTYPFVRHFPYIAQTTILVFLIRSHALGYRSSPQQCRDWIIYQLAVMEAITLAVEAVLIVRIYAMFNRNKVIIITVVLLFLAEVAAMITVIAVSIPGITFSSQCLITHAPGAFSAYWFLSLAFETILFGLTLVKFYSSVSRRLGKRSILFVLVRDGTWAYGIIFGIMLLNLLMYHLIDNALAGLCFFWELTTMSFAGSHVLLNLRRLAVRHGRLETSGWSIDENYLFSFPPTQTSDISSSNVRRDAALIELQILKRTAALSGT